MRKSIRKGMLAVVCAVGAILALAACKTDSTPVTKPCEHEYCDWEVAVEATCEGIGYDARTCAVCDDVDCRFYEALGHNYTEKITAPTCTAEGYSTHTCHRCGDFYTSDIQPMRAHAFGEWNVLSTATCKTDGYRYRTCADCLTVEEEKEAATGHTPLLQTAVVDGVTREYYTCRDCRYSTYEEVNSGHIFNGDSRCLYCGVDFGMSAYRNDAAYLDLGKKANGQKLQALYTEIDNVVMWVHTNEWDIVGEDRIAIAVDYKAHGLSSEEALTVHKGYVLDNPLYYWIDKKVGYTEDSIYITIQEEYVNGKDRVAFNAVIEEKIQEYLTLVEGEDNPYEIALAFHDKIIWETKYAYDSNGQANTASWAHSVVGPLTKGEAVCEGYAELFQLLLTARGIPNVLASGTVRNAAHAWNLIALDDGNWYWCDLTWDDVDRRAAGWGVQHQYFCVNDKENVLWRDGGGGFLSGTLLDNHELTPEGLLGIEYWYSLPSRSEKSYEYPYKLRSKLTIGQNTYAIAGYRALQLVKCEATGDVVIPETETYEGTEYKVISIGTMMENGIYGPVYDYHLFNENPTSLHFPQTLVYIWDRCFRTQEYSIARITVDERNAYYKDVDGILYTKSLHTLIAYPTAYPAESYVMPDETMYITDCAIEYCKNLKSLTAGKSLFNFCVAGSADGAFDNWKIVGGIAGGLQWIINSCENLKEVTVSNENPYYLCEGSFVYRVGKDGIGLYGVVDREIKNYHVSASLQYIDNVGSVFGKAFALESFTVEDGNEYFSVKDGILYNKQQTEVIFVPQNIQGEISIAEGVTEIRGEFGGRDGITKITMSDNVRSLQNGAFSSCSNLESVTLSKNITVISENCFYNCDKLQSVTLSDNVTKIEKYAFAYSDSLEEIVISESVTEIGENAFKHCNNLKKIYYGGSEASWKQAIGENEIPPTVEIVFEK